MNVNMVCQGMQEMYPDTYFAESEYSFTHGSLSDLKGETINGLLSIITLSMQCFEIMARHGYMQHGLDREGLIQDNDPYVEGLLRMIRNGIEDKG